MNFFGGRGVRILGVLCLEVRGLEILVLLYGGRFGLIKKSKIVCIFILYYDR